MSEDPSHRPALLVDGLSKRYGPTPAIYNVSLAVQPGQAVGLVGPNGSGKSTLIQSCVGILRPEAGRVFVGGFDLTAGSLRAKRALAFAPEFPDPVPSLTPWDHLTFCGQALRVPGWQEEGRRLLLAFDMWDKKDRKASSLSKGERQKTMLALALLRRPRMLFLDEPLIGLDPRAALTLKREVRALLASGGAALISSHVLSLVEELCSSLAVLSRGQVVFRGTGQQLREVAKRGADASLEEAFVWIAAPGEASDVPPIGGGGEPPAPAPPVGAPPRGR